MLALRRRCAPGTACAVHLAAAVSTALHTGAAATGRVLAPAATASRHMQSSSSRHSIALFPAGVSHWARFGSIAAASRLFSASASDSESRSPGTDSSRLPPADCQDTKKSSSPPVCNASDTSVTCTTPGIQSYSDAMESLERAHSDGWYYMDEDLAIAALRFIRDDCQYRQSSQHVTHQNWERIWDTINTFSERHVQGEFGLTFWPLFQAHHEREWQQEQQRPSINAGTLSSIPPSADSRENGVVCSSTVRDILQSLLRSIRVTGACEALAWMRTFHRPAAFEIDALAFNTLLGGHVEEAQEAIKPVRVKSERTEKNSPTSRTESPPVFDASRVRAFFDTIEERYRESKTYLAMAGGSVLYGSPSEWAALDEVFDLQRQRQQSRTDRKLLSDQLQCLVMTFRMAEKARAWDGFVPMPLTDRETIHRIAEKLWHEAARPPCTHLNRYAVYEMLRIYEDHSLALQADVLVRALALEEQMRQSSAHSNHSTDAPAWAMPGYVLVDHICLRHFFRQCAEVDLTFAVEWQEFCTALWRRALGDPERKFHTHSWLVAHEYVMYLSRASPSLHAQLRALWPTLDDEFKFTHPDTYLSLLQECVRQRDALFASELLSEYDRVRLTRKSRVGSFSSILLYAWIDVAAAVGDVAQMDALWQRRASLNLVKEDSADEAPIQAHFDRLRTAVVGAAAAGASTLEPLHRFYWQRYRHYFHPRFTQPDDPTTERKYLWRPWSVEPRGPEALLRRE